MFLKFIFSWVHGWQNANLDQCLQEVHDQPSYFHSHCSWLYFLFFRKTLGNANVVQQKISGHFKQCNGIGSLILMKSWRFTSLSTHLDTSQVINTSFPRVMQNCEHWWDPERTQVLCCKIHFQELKCLVPKIIPRFLLETENVKDISVH